MSGTAGYYPRVMRSDGRVGTATYKGRAPVPVPDPSPGVNCVLHNGTIGPCPGPEEREKQLNPQPQQAPAAQAQARRR
jgi:hypothetical protein